MHNEIVTLKVDGLNIAGQLYLPDGDGPFPSVCICHGIPAGRPDPGAKGYPLLAERICHHGFATFIFNFRGTGPSDGNFDILGWARDLQAVIDYLYVLPKVDKFCFSLLGFSAGAAVSIYVAAHSKKVSSVVTCACPAEFIFLTKPGGPSPVIDHFRNIGIIRDNDFPHSNEDWLNNFRQVSPVKHVSRIAPRPLLLVHGNQDELVDVSHAHKLYDKAGEPKQIIIVDGVGHRLRQNDNAMVIVINWLKSQVQPNGRSKPLQIELQPENRL